MMLPRDTRLGDLQLTEVLLEYDGPQLFVCKNSQGGLYLSMHAPTRDENDNWLFLPITPRRLRRVREGKLSLRGAFERPEHGLLEVVSFDPRRSASVKALEPHELDGAFLPDHDAFLIPPAREPALLVAARRSLDEVPDTSGPLWELSPSTIAFLRSVRTSVVSVAHVTRRYVFDLMLKPEGSSRTDVPAMQLSALLAVTQRAVDVFGLEPSALTSRGPLKAAIRDATRLRAVAVFPSSFGIRLETDQASLVDVETTSRAFARLHTLLSSMDDLGALINQIKELNPRQTLHARALAKVLSDIGSDIEIAIGIPDEGRPLIAYAHSGAIRRASDFLTSQTVSNEEKRDFQGILVGASLRSKFFLLENDQESISGRISDQALSMMSGKQLDKPHRATIIISREVNPNTGEESERFILERLEQIED